MDTALWDLGGRTALVTGASSGLGAHFAKVLASFGAHVIMAARRPAELNAQADEVRGAGGKCSTLSLDVSDSSSIAAAGELLSTVDILVNNAGLVREGGALDQSEPDWDIVLDTNLKGVFLLSQAVAKAMRARGASGSIINIASILGLRQSAGVLPYAVSKAGVIQLTKTMALELARFGVRVNALAPGYFATELNEDFWKSQPGEAMIKRMPFRRLGQLDELNGPLLLLASDASRFMTGSVVTVDGGHMVSGL